MSQTKAQLLDPQGDFTLTGQLIGVGATFSGDVSVGGTLTKQDVTNVDSIGVITARNRIDMTQGYQLGWKSGTTERARIHGDSGSNFIIETGATPTERVRVTSSGRVGIGSNSPKTSLDVAGLVNLVNGSPEVHFTTGASHYNWRVAAQEVVDEGFEIASGTQSADGVNDTYSTKLVLKADGKLGINKTNPSGMLHISGDNNSNGPELYLNVNNNNTTDNIGALIYGNNADNTVLKIQGVTHTANNTGDLTFHTSTTGTMGERLRITSDGKIGMGLESTSGSICTPDGNALLIRAASTVGTVKGHIMLTGDGATNGEGPQIVFSESGSGGNFAGAYIGHTRTGSNSIGNLVFATRATGGDASTIPTVALTLSDSQTATFAGTVSDNKGSLRSIPRLDKTSAYTITAADAGKAITADGNITIPNSTMAEGDAITIIADGSGDITITQGSGLVMYNAGDASTGNRTLALRGVATIWFKHTSYAYISGSGLS
tara:strand:- start:40 stop:1506 length:1467 start_codon:yes stop_codon:yes gene_type:complete